VIFPSGYLLGINYASYHSVTPAKVFKILVLRIAALYRKLSFPHLILAVSLIFIDNRFLFLASYFVGKNLKEINSASLLRSKDELCASSIERFLFNRNLSLFSSSVVQSISQFIFSLFPML